MTINPSFPTDATALLTGLSYTAMQQVMLHQAQEHELQVVEDSESAVSIEMPSLGQYRFEPADEGICVRISAALPDRLFMLKDSFSEALSHLLPEASKDLRWSDSATLPNRPPNLHFTRVVSITWLTRKEAQDLPRQALAALRELPEHFLWLASEKSDVTPLREALKADKPAPGTSYLAAYWSKP